MRHEQHIEILEHIRKFYCYKSVVSHTRRDVSSTVRLLIKNYSLNFQILIYVKLVTRNTEIFRVAIIAILCCETNK